MRPIDTSSVLFGVFVLIFLLILLWPHFFYKLLLLAKGWIFGTEDSKTERTVNYISSGIVFLATPLPNTETFGIPQDLCPDATPGDLIEIGFTAGIPSSARVIEVREHRNDSGSFD